MVYSSWMRPDLECYTGTELFIRSMYEASRLPSGFTRSEVTVPLVVVPDGIDPAAYPYLAGPQRPVAR